MTDGDPYTYPGTKTLVNKFNIQDSQKLQEIEGAMWASALMRPLPQGQFDYGHLKAIHKHFFGAAYDWAGQERSVDIIKGHSHFARKEFIESELNKVFAKLKADNHLQGLAPDDFCKKLSYYFNEVNAAHPFREGNGRTLRAFSDLLAKDTGYNLDWNKVSEKEYIDASIAGFNADYAPMEKVFNKISSHSESIHISEGKIHINDSLSTILGDYMESQQNYDAAATKYFANISNPNKKEFRDTMDEASIQLKDSINAVLKNPDYHELIKHRKYELPVNQKNADNQLDTCIKSKVLTTGDVYKVISKIDSNSRMLGLNPSETQSRSRKI